MYFYFIDSIKGDAHLTFEAAILNIHPNIDPNSSLLMVSTINYYRHNGNYKWKIDLDNHPYNRVKYGLLPS